VETLWVQGYDGESWGPWEGWSQRTLRATNVVPTVSVVRGLAGVDQWLSVRDLDFMVYGDGDGDAWELGQMRDLSAGAGSGYLWFDGSDVVANQVVEFNADEWSRGRLWMRGGAVPGTHGYEVRFYDGMDWSAWTGVSVVTRSGNQRPEVTAVDRTVTVGQTVGVGTLFGAADADGDGLSRFRLWDGGNGGDSGAFVVSGVVQAARTTLEVGFAQLGATQYRGGAQAGTETLWAQVYDGRDWSEWKNWNVTTIA